MSTKVDRRDKYALAFRLYMDTGMRQSEIAEMVGVTEKTITQWKLKNDWETLKAAHGVTASEIIAGYLRQLKALKDDIAKREYPYPTPKDSDVIMKIAKSIKILQNDLTLSNYITACEQLLKFAMNMKPEIVQQLAALTREFVQLKAKELSKA